MSQTLWAAPRAATTMIAGCASALTLLLTAAPAADARPARSDRSGCADRLCMKDIERSRSCWRFDRPRKVSRCFITRAAIHYGQSRRQALAIAYRESRYHWRVVNRSSGAAGLYQFMPGTWSFTPYRKKSALHPRWASLAAMWMWKKGYQSHWSTY